MKRSQRTVLLSLVALPVFLVASCSLVLPSYDHQARQNALRQMAGELPPQASMAEMEQFMLRHAPGRYAYDEINGQWAGLLPQRSFDRALFGRQVGVYL